MELVKSLIGQARARASQPAVMCRGVKLTYSDLASAIARFAQGLVSKGVVPGDRVCICLGNGIEFVVAYYGSMAAGAVAVPLNPGLKASERQAFIEVFSLAAIIEPTDFAAVADGAGWTENDSIDGADTLERVASSACRARSCPAVAAILVTSGSTGEPKGVMLSGRALLANALGIGDAAGSSPGRTHLVTLPLFHSFGATVSMNMPLATGGCCAIAPVFIPEAVGALAESTSAQIWAAVPAMLASMAMSRCNGSELRSVTTCISGGAPLPAEVRRGFEAKFGIAVREGYGLTEAAPVVSATRHDEIPEHGCVGRPIAGVSVKLLASSEEQEACDDGIGPGQGPGPGRGELLVGGEGLMEGYFGAPDLTAAVISDGWLHTGDIASIDADGRVWIHDRACYVVNVGGFKVYPGEVEASLLGHPCVAEAMAIGMPDAMRGQVVAALVRLRPDGPDTTPAELVRFARERMAAFKVPRTVVIVDELPRNDTGKPARGRAIEMIQEATQVD